MTERERPGRIPMDLDLPVMEGSEVGEEFETTDLGTCLVTGAAGFLGRNLVFELIRRGERVRAFDCVDLPYSHEHLEFVKQSFIVDQDRERREAVSKRKMALSQDR